MFYVLISGKRDFEDYEQFCKILDESLKDISDDIVIVEGGARGTDALAKHYADEHAIQCQEFPALWDINGRAAGPMRNSEMVKFVSGKDSKAIFFWDGKSKGTYDCLKKAKKAKIVCEVYLLDALNICKCAIKPYEGVMPMTSLEIDRWVKDRLEITSPTDNIYFSVSDPTISTIDNFNNAMVNMEIRRMKNE